MEVAYTDADLARLVGFVVSHFDVAAKQRGIDLRVELPEALPAQVDPDKLQRAVFNVVGNAFKFTPDGGRVRCSLTADGARAWISVADSGPGIPPDKREVVFDPFRQLEAADTRRFGGTGLGLAIARDFVDLHRGTMLWIRRRRGAVPPRVGAEPNRRAPESRLSVGPHAIARG